ncbi:MAG: hypothetical protein HQK77_21925 [Desulfobacterales bacterium]|nr:hypothetical protein [Desulfobacterales bacterium]
MNTIISYCAAFDLDEDDFHKILEIETIAYPIVVQKAKAREQKTKPMSRPKARRKTK